MMKNSTLLRPLLVLTVTIFISFFVFAQEGLITAETFDAGENWKWRGSCETVWDELAHSNVLLLTCDPPRKAHAMAGPITLPHEGTYTLRWRCRTKDVTRPVSIGLQLGERTLQEFEGAIQGRTTDWLWHEISFIVLAGEEELFIHLSFAEEGKAWFDDLTLTETPTAFSSPAMIDSGASFLILNDWGLVASVYPLCKVYPDTSFTTDLPRVDSLQLSAARNETEQIMLVLNPSYDQHVITVGLSVLTGPGEIPAENLSWRLVESVTLPATALRSSYGRAGKNPDPLVPVLSFEAKAGKNTTLLFQIDVPSNVPAGLYHGEIILRGDSVIRLPLELSVWDFDLPVLRTLHSEAGFRARWGSTTLEDETLQIAANLIEHGHIPQRAIAMELDDTSWLYPDGDHVVIDFAVFDGIVEEWLARGVREFVLPPVGLHRRTPKGARLGPWLGFTPLTPEFNASFADYLKQLEEHLKEKGWLEHTYIYLWDEPSAEEIETFKELLLLVRRAAPDLRTAVAGSNLPNPELYGLIDIWTPNLRRQILGDADWERLRERQSLGETAGAYGNNRYAMDTPLNFIRLWPWMLRRYGLTLTGWWSVNSWPEDPWFPSTPRLGLGYLLYPPLEQGGPILDSLRWEALQAGMEDYEYLTLLHQYTEEVRTALKGESLFSGEALVQQFIAPLVWGTTERDFSSDTALLEAVRHVMGNEISESLRPPLILTAFEPSSSSIGILHVLVEPGATVTVNGVAVSLRNDRYAGEVTRISDEAFFVIEASLGDHHKRITRFWPGVVTSTGQD